MEHHVYFWLKDEHKTDKDRAAFIDGLRTLLGIPSVAGGVVGVPAETEERPVVDKSWDFATSLRFDSLEDQSAYQTDPIHEAFVEKFSDWWKKVIVRDVEAL